MNTVPMSWAPQVFDEMPNNFLLEECVNVRNVSTESDQEPPQEAVLKAISEVSKTEGRVGQTTNMVLGGTVTDDSTDEWLALDQKDLMPQDQQLILNNHIVVGKKEEAELKITKEPLLRSSLGNMYQFLPCVFTKIKAMKN